METTGRLIAQCINIGGRKATGATCPPPFAAATPNPDGLCGAQRICGPIPIPTLDPLVVAECAADPTLAQCNPLSVGSLISTVMGFLYPVAGIIIFFVFVSAGYDYIMSYGDPERINAAWAKMTYGLIGFGILLGSYLFVRIIAVILGFDSPF